MSSSDKQEPNHTKAGLIGMGVIFGLGIAIGVVSQHLGMVWR